MPTTKSVTDRVQFHTAMINHSGRSIVLSYEDYGVIEYFIQSKEYVVENVNGAHVITKNGKKLFSSTREAQNFLNMCRQRTHVNSTRLGQEIINSFAQDKHFFITNPSVFHSLDESDILEWFWEKWT